MQEPSRIQPHLRRAGIVLRTFVSTFCVVAAYATAAVLWNDSGLLPRIDIMVLSTILAVAATGALLTWCGAVVWRATGVVVLSLLSGLYLFEGYVIEWTTLLSGPGRPVDPRAYWEYIRDAAARGESVVLAAAPSEYAVSRATLKVPGVGEIVPLAGAARARTLMCKEGDRPFTVYTSDEYGFNNPPGLWQPPVDVVIVGDSFAFGACVPHEDHFVQMIRNRYARTLNLGYGGNGPLVELALVREYVSRLHPAFVFWVYDENNDVYSINEALPADLEYELDHPLLMRYLEDRNFSQGLFDKREAIDRVVGANVRDRIRQRIGTTSRWIRFLSASNTRWLVRNAAIARSQARPGAAPASPASREVRSGAHILAFRRILQEASREVRAAGGRFIFVSIPSIPTICQSMRFSLRWAVLAAAEEASVDVIDLERDFKNAAERNGTASLFGIPPCGGHLSPAGYRIVGDRLLEFLALASDETKDLPTGWKAEPVQAARSAGEVPRRYLRYEGVVGHASPEPERVPSGYSSSGSRP
jgi:hypothetical protein